MKIALSLLALFLIFNQPDQRQQLIDYIFGGALPTRQPDVIVNDTSFSLDNLASVERVTINLDNGLYSVIYQFNPTIANGQLMIYHGGHGEPVESGLPFIQDGLSRGYTMALIEMPLSPVNGGPSIIRQIGGQEWHMDSHDALQWLKPTQGSPIRYFIEPVIVYLNYAAGHYTHISMAGLSGGGWTTTLAAAIDSRIESSYPVAGSMPLRLRYWGDWGDWEQSDYGLYSIASYEDLYLLGACNGRQLQILNRRDSCCFVPDGREAYAVEVRAQATALGCDYNLWVDETAMTHEISAAARDRIFGELQSFGVIRRYWLPIVK